jgi:hypothetical protein
MSGIFDAIFGNNSGVQQGTQPAATPAASPVSAPAATADTPDAQGLTSGDRFQAGMSGLSQLGAVLLAAGQPMWGPDRARILAGLGNVPEAINQSMAGSVGRRKAAQGMKVTDAQLKAQAAMQEMANGDMSAYSPEMQKLMKAAFMSGKPEVAAAMLKQVHEMQKPINLGGGTIGYRKPDGTYEAFNPMYNERYSIDGSGQQTSPARTAAPETRSSPATGTFTPTPASRRSGWRSRATRPAMTRA